MKKIATILLTLTIAMCTYAQSAEKAPVFKKNEVKINLPITILSSYPEISYERILSTDLSVGASLGFSLEKKIFF